jgi:hypothetical protein
MAVGERYAPAGRRYERTKEGTLILVRELRHSPARIRIQLSGHIAEWPFEVVPPISDISADCVEIGNQFRRNLKQRRLKILAKMLYRGCSRDLQNIGRSPQKPG